MKKLIGLLLCFLMLSGCESLDYEMMVCKYQGMNSLYYEIRYKEDAIRDIIVVEYLDLKDVPEQVYKERLDYFEKLQKIMERYAGIDAYLENDGKELSLKTVVDHEKYDCYKDSLDLFKVDLVEGDFDSVETLRNKFVTSTMECDVLVSLEKINE